MMEMTSSTHISIFCQINETVCAVYQWLWVGCGSEGSINCSVGSLIPQLSLSTCQSVLEKDMKPKLLLMARAVPDSLCCSCFLLTALCFHCFALKSHWSTTELTGVSMANLPKVSVDVVLCYQPSHQPDFQETDCLFHALLTTSTYRD